MAECIEREAVLKELCKVSAPTPSESWIVEKCIEKVNDAPTVDAVEVVRCEDCKHRYEPTRCALWYGECNGKQYFLERGDNFYCSYGERMDK